ncbi:hypothetical protein [Leptothermofonsia sp. ETS-13]|uniref:hypothetical protein n=1 Tax=Leptothermofonsia sp. ETS-13 TaxID=3035696 RepID=UPI003B9DC625
MNRTFVVGISVALLSTLTAPGANAETRVEAQLRLTHPNHIAVNHPVQPTKGSSQKKVNSTSEQVHQSNSETENKLSERDRIIQEYRTQTVIPVQVIPAQ